MEHCTERQRVEQEFKENFEQSFESRFNMTRRSAYARWLSDPAFNVAMTLNFNTPVTLANARTAIGRCFAKVDRHLLGRKFTQPERRDRRTRGVFVFEHVKSNLHAHGLLRVQPDRLERLFGMFPVEGRGVWCEAWSGGTQWTTNAHDPGGFAFYFAKEQRASSAPETMLFLEDFFPAGG